MKVRPGFKLVLTLCLMTAASASYAQKPPTIQTASLRASANIKIDGKATEWGDHFMAFSNKIASYYTIANDDDRLYLVVQICDEQIARKAVRGGITFTVNVTGSKNDKDSPAFIFPKYDKMDPQRMPAYKYSLSPTATPTENALYLDSLAKARNRQLNDWAKVIGIKGLIGITEPEISLYNDESIAAAMRFDSNLYCVYELAIPLKKLGLSIVNPAKVAYQIKLNGAAVNGTNIRDLREGKFFAWEEADGKTYTEGSGNGSAAEQIFPTDFWGEYTLAEKP